VKYAWIDTHRDEFELAPMCEALTVSMSGYRAWKGGGSPTRTRLTDTQMLALIQAIHQELKGAYGSPRMVRELRDRGFPASKEADLFDYIEPFYNRRRQHSTLGYASPMKFLDDWISIQDEQQLAA
jgi:hypothetical protein